MPGGRRQLEVHLRRALAAAGLMLGLTLAGCSLGLDHGPEGAALPAVGALAPPTANLTAATADDVAAPSPFDHGDAHPAITKLRQVIAHPSSAEILKPGPLPEMSLGRSDAPLAVVQYASLTCPYCRRFLIETFPEFKRRYLDTGKVRFILREFPIGFQSGAATIALRCAPASDYFKLYERFMMNQAAWVSQEVRHDPIYEIVKPSGLTRDKFDACYKDEGLIKALSDVKDRGRTLGVIGTPNFFVGDTLVKTPPSTADFFALLDARLAPAPQAKAN